MSAPRYVPPASCWFITRRVAQRQFLLLPDEVTKQVFEFCLALAADKFHIDILAWDVMSNHYHSVVYDEKGQVPAFLQFFHRVLAAAFNERFERSENFWSSEPPCITRLVTEEDVVEKIVYTLGNPVEAKLVDKIADWPGSSSLHYHDGKPRILKRPDLYFSEKRSAVPEEVSLRIVQPPKSRKNETFEAWIEHVTEKLAKFEERADRRRETDPTFRSCGVEEVLAKPPTATPAKEEIKRKLRPHVGCKDREPRIASIYEVKEFRLHYADALAELEHGDAVVVFPEGTYRRPKGCRVVIGKRPPIAPERLRKHVMRIPNEEVVEPLAEAS